MIAEERVPFPVIVSGPTASGKTALATKLARSFGSAVWNIDSVQVYRDLVIGAACPTAEEMGEVPHYLYGVRSPAERWNVVEYLAALESMLTRCPSDAPIAVLSGGSTLYIQAFLTGLADLPPADSQLRNELEHHTDAVLYRMLLTSDPERAAQLAPADRRRVIRALEAVHRGELPSERFRSQRTSTRPAVVLVLCLPRAELYDRINRRAAAMVASGLLEETKQAVARYGVDAPALDALGYAEARKVLRGELPEAELAPQVAMHTRRFAKRQTTFWRNEPRKRGWRAWPEQPQATQRREPHDLHTVQLSFPELVARLQEVAHAPSSEPQVWYLDASAAGPLWGC